jgi:hypothetical protein
MTTTWSIDICPEHSENMHRYSSVLLNFIDFNEIINCNYVLNLKAESFSFLEKFIFDNISFHMNRLGIESDDKTVTFWSKKREYNTDYLHMHIDHCDYEARVLSIQSKRPLFSSIIYLDDNNCPTLVTDVTTDMVSSKNFINNNNKKILFSFPKVLKNIVFESGKYFHGESYLSEYERTSRKAIVIAVWDRNNKPFYIPYFDKHFFYYFLFLRFEREIVDTEFNEFTRESVVFKTESRDKDIVIIQLNKDTYINNDLFEKIIIHRDKTTLYRFFDVIYNRIPDPDTIILKFSESNN